VAARDPARAAALEPAGGVYADYDDLLADPDVDAVYISLANDAHLPWTLRAVSTGKAVLCEKPLGMSAAEVDQIAAAGGTVVETSWYRWHPRIRLAQDVLAAGRIGAVRHVAAAFTFEGVPADNYRLDPRLGGGALYDVGCYAVSAALWACGGRAPAEVAARARWSDTGVDLVTEAQLGWLDGATAEVRAAIDEPESQWLTITGERGQVELPGEPYTTMGGQESEVVVSDERGAEHLPAPAADAYQVMVEEMSSVLDGGPGWLLSLAESRACAATLDACFASARGDGEPTPVMAG
ncbi:MAG: Gfo/Idh/MocA family oxidoreductase, partial [Actinomycetota bacterium]|nr:Gfo/Idh/MocA family oxidoreductase [Actinomycetota bacterium]